MKKLPKFAESVVAKYHHGRILLQAHQLKEIGIVQVIENLAIL